MSDQGKFSVDSSEKNGTLFTNDQQSVVSVTFTASGTWNTGSKIDYGPEGKVGAHNPSAAYPKSTLYALVAVNSNNEVVGEGATIKLALQPDECVRFVVNDTHYPNNSGQLTVDWEINAATARQLPIAGKKMKIVQLMRAAQEERDVEWLKESLQAAIELEHATIPPYLCGMWSVSEIEESPFVYSEVPRLIVIVARDEMVHMGLACNMLTAIGGKPQIANPEFIPRYPGGLPGGVHPGLIVSLQALSPEYIHDVYMEIELPEDGPIPDAELEEETYPTIGNFYDAVLTTFKELAECNKITFDTSFQVSTEKLEGVDIINDISDVERAINRIVEEGEGSSTSPVDSRGALSHYYKFSEIYEGKRLQLNGTWDYTGDEIVFPEVFPMAPIPAGGYPEKSREFDKVYSQMLRKLQDAWNGGGNTSLDSAVSEMRRLQTLARTLMQTPIDDNDLPNANYGPSFLYIPPTWGNDIEYIFSSYDKKNLKVKKTEKTDEFVDLSSYKEVSENAQGIYDAVSIGEPTGEPWPEFKIQGFKAWMDAGCLES